MQRIHSRHFIEREYEWDKWRKEIPDIKFPSDWKVKIIPPFGGAVIRFLVSKGSKTVSVYLDCYGELGAMDKPYWEIYPDKDGYNSRFYINEVDEFMQEIKNSLNS
jgi:hypothetical protein